MFPRASGAHKVFPTHPLISHTHFINEAATKIKTKQIMHVLCDVKAFSLRPVSISTRLLNVTVALKIIAYSYYVKLRRLQASV